MPFNFGNPYVLAVVAAIAIGVVIYEAVTRQKERKVSYGRPRRPPSPGLVGPPNSSTKPKEPSNSSKPIRGSSNSSLKPNGSSNSSKSSSAPGGSSTTSTKPKDCPNSSVGSGDTLTSSRESGNPNIGCTESHVRKRIVTTSETKELNETESRNNKEQSVIYQPLQSKERNLQTNTYYQNIDEKNYKKDVYEKVLNDTMGANMENKSKQNLNKNIFDEDSDSENSISEKANIKLCNTDVSDGSISSLGDCNNLSSLKETEEEIYKKNVLDTLKRENVGSQKAVGTSGGSSHVQHHDQREKIVNNMKQGKCSGCDESSINVVVYPCEHRYLCSDCARRIFQIYNKCSICHTDIVDFKVQSM